VWLLRVFERRRDAHGLPAIILTRANGLSEWNRNVSRRRDWQRLLYGAVYGVQQQRGLPIRNHVLHGLRYGHMHLNAPLCAQGFACSLAGIADSFEVAFLTKVFSSRVTRPS
jgi:hypothetical protein